MVSVLQQRGSPFIPEISAEVVAPNFKLLDLPKYDGTRDPQEHLIAYEHVMLLYEQFEVINVHIFIITLTDRAQEWFTSLLTGMVISYENLVHKFLNHFASKKKSQRKATYLFTIRQEEYESLRDFINRFNNIAFEVND